MSPTLQISLAALAFGLTAFLATRLRLGIGEKGGPRYVSSYAMLWSMRFDAARSYINRLLLRMGWAWVLVCAPLLAYRPESGLDIKVYGGVLAGCLLLGIILSSVTYDQVAKFESVDVGEAFDDRTAGAIKEVLERGGPEAAQLVRWMAETRKTEREAALEKAMRPLRRSNNITLALVIVAAALIPLVHALAVWASSLGTVGYVVVVAASLLVILIAYMIATFTRI